MMTAILRALKERDAPCAAAEILVRTSEFVWSDGRQIFIGDNYSENKNNTNLAWACMMVSHGWFKEVRFLYGPPGHTHNGIDAVHNVHNQNVGASPSQLVLRACLLRLTAAAYSLSVRRPGSYVTGTLANFVNLFPTVWKHSV
jgi:hypothetical protein